MDKNKWGPYAWHLLHRVSIQNKEIINNSKIIYYETFFKTFLYILPCELCKDHYSDVINFINPINISKINRKYIIKWANKTHNIINEFIDKPQFNIKDTILYHNKTNNEIIFTFLNGVYENLENISIEEFDNIYTFLICLSKLYPDNNIRINLRNIISNNDFKNIKTTNQLKGWYINNKELWQLTNIQINKI